MQNDIVYHQIDIFALYLFHTVSKVNKRDI